MHFSHFQSIVKSMQTQTFSANTRLEVIISLIVSGLLTIIASNLAIKANITGPQLFVTITTFIILIAGYLLLATIAVSGALQSYLTQHPHRLWLVTGCLLIPYIIYIAGSGAFYWLGLSKLLLFIFFPTLLISLRTAHNISPQLDWRDAIAILSIWLPFDLRWLKQIWVGNTEYLFNVLIAVNLAVLIFVCYRRLPDVGYHFRATKKIFFTGLVNFLLFAPIAIILGQLLGFLKPLATQMRSPLAIILFFLQVFMFTAIPEELLFRGIIQNFLIKTLSKKWLAILIASLLFGLSHWNNAATLQNKLSYCLLATIAGFFYSRAYLATNSLLAAAITHALIDVTWHELFP